MNPANTELILNHLDLAWILSLKDKASIQFCPPGRVYKAGGKKKTTQNKKDTVQLLRLRILLLTYLAKKLKNQGRGLETFLIDVQLSIMMFLNNKLKFPLPEVQFMQNTGQLYPNIPAVFSIYLQTNGFLPHSGFSNLIDPLILVFPQRVGFSNLQLSCLLFQPCIFHLKMHRTKGIELKQIFNKVIYRSFLIIFSYCFMFI